MIPWIKECKRPLVRRIPGVYLSSSGVDFWGMSVCSLFETGFEKAHASTDWGV